MSNRRKRKPHPSQCPEWLPWIATLTSESTGRGDVARDIACDASFPEHPAEAIDYLLDRTADTAVIDRMWEMLAAFTRVQAAWHRRENVRNNHPSNHQEASATTNQRSNP